MNNETKRKLFKLLGIVILAIPLLLIVYHMTACSLVGREESSSPRDPDTGILVGAEPYYLGPKVSNRAALLVHGHVGAPNNFGELPELLADDGWRVHVMLLPGHGTTPHDYAETTPEELIAAVETELRSLEEDYEQVAIIGHSMGGSLSTIAASNTEVDALVLAAPYFGVTYHWYYVLPPEWWTRIVSPIVRWVYKGDIFMQVNRKEAKDDIISYRWVPVKSLLTLQSIGHTANDEQLLQSIEAPVLWIHSPNDQAASYEEAEQAFTAIGSETKEHASFPRSNHHLFYDFDRDEVNQTILEFLSSAVSSP